MDHTPTISRADVFSMTMHRTSAHLHPSAISIDAQFIVMLEAFRPYGGLARRGELEASVLQRFGDDAESASKFLRNNRILSFDWGGQTWVPLFQFTTGPAAPALCANAARIVDVLRSYLDGWRTALWFVRRNAALGGATPLTQLALNPDLVLAAARCASGERLN